MLMFDVDPSTFDGDNNPPETQVEDIVVINPNGNWHLYNHGHLELTRDCDKQYTSLWDLPESERTLVIGGGDYQLASLLKGEVEVVDPNIEEYAEWHKFYLGEPKKGIPMTFMEYLPVDKEYDLVLIDVSEPLMGITDEIYCEDFFINLKKIKAKHYMMYMPPLVFDDLVPKLRKHFDMIASKGAFIPDWNEHCDIITFQSYN